MTRTPNVLTISEDRGAREHMARLLECGGFVVDVVDSAEAGVLALSAIRYDVLLFDEAPLNLQLLQVLSSAARLQPQMATLVMTSGDLVSAERPQLDGTIARDSDSADEVATSVRSALEHRGRRTAASTFPTRTNPRHAGASL